MTKLGTLDSAPTWGGAVLVAPGCALYTGPAGDTRPHRHHALQLAIGLECPFEAELNGAAPYWVDALLVEANVEHRIIGHGERLAVYYVDGASSDGRWLSGCLAGDPARALTGHTGELRQCVREALKQDRSTALAFLRDRIAKILQSEPPTSSTSESAVQRVCRLLESSLASPPRVGELARRSGLLQRALSARFRRETGLTIRRYVLWLRLKTAIEALAQGSTLTDAALEAGFSDAAHLSRTFKQMFGVSPSDSVSASTVEVVD